LAELTPRRAQDLLPREVGDGVDQGHGVLELVAEAEGPARLVEARASPHPAGHDLVHQPTVDQVVDGVIRGLDVDAAQDVVPVLPYRFQGAAGLGWGAEALAEIVEI